MQAHSGGCRVVKGPGAWLIEGDRLHVEGSYWLYGGPRWELGVQGFWKTLGGHKVLLGDHGTLIHGRGHRLHRTLHVGLRSKPGRPLLAWGVIEARAPTLMGPTGHVKPGTQLARPLKASGTVKPHGTHLVARALKVWGPLLLEAHRSGAHVVEADRTFKVLNRTFYMAWTPNLSLVADRGLLAYRGPKPDRPLRGSVKASHAVSFHWTMSHVWPLTISSFWHVMRRGSTIKPAGPGVVGSIKLWLLKTPQTPAFEPAGSLGPRGAHGPGSAVACGRLSSFVRRRVSRGVSVWMDRGQGPSTRRALQSGFRGRSMGDLQGPVVGVFTVWTLKSWDRTHVRRVLLMQRRQALPFKT